MTYASWEPRHRVTTIAPGKLDVFVVTLIDGRRAALQPVTEYDAALAKARAFGRDNRCQVKVLALTATEARNLLALAPGAAPGTDDDADRRLLVNTLLLVAREGEDPDARREAIDLLTQMGALKP